MQDRKVIAFVGMPGAGKSFCVDYLKSKGLHSVYFGGIVVDEVEARGLEVNESNEKLVREELRATHGPGVMAERILAKIDLLFQQGNKILVADGLYSWTEYKIFKEHFGDHAVIIAITAPRKLRHERMSKRSVRPLNSQQVAAREFAEIENIEKGGPIANADYTITNNATTDELQEAINLILKNEGIILE